MSSALRERVAAARRRAAQGTSLRPSSLFSTPIGSGGGGALQGTVDPVVYGNQLLGLDTEHAVDGKVKDVLKDYTFYIVPSMCPDGAFCGHLRTNADGQNLNREWCSTGSK